MVYETSTWIFILNVPLELYIKSFCQMFYETETGMAGFRGYAFPRSAFWFCCLFLKKNKLMIAQWIFC